MRVFTVCTLTVMQIKLLLLLLCQYAGYLASERERNEKLKCSGRYTYRQLIGYVAVLFIYFFIFQRVLAVNHSSCVLPILVKERAVLPTPKQGAVHLAAVVARRSFSIATIRW